MTENQLEKSLNDPLPDVRTGDRDMIVLDGVFRIYKTKSVEVVALRGLNLTVKEGELISIMGPSGCGKSTMLNIIGGLDQPSAGKVVIDEKDISSMDKDSLIEFRRKNVGFIFQFFNLVPSLTARENIELPMRLHGVPGNEMKEKVDALLVLVGMDKRGNHRPDELSGGEQQRIAIATALANDPPILLADEPTGELDSESGQMVLDLFSSLNKESGKTIVIVTHDPRTATIAHRSFSIEDGQIKGEYTREMYESEGKSMDLAKYKKMVENIVDKQRRMEKLMKEIMDIEKDLADGI